MEAGRSLGATRWQLLRQVRLPLARRMILVGINQTTMCALSMVTIAALINAPGLGAATIVALRHNDVGESFRAGLAIVVLAIVLDRVTTAAGVRADARPDPATRRVRRWTLAVGAGVTAVAIYLAYTFTWAAFAPLADDDGLFGAPVVDAVNAADRFIRDHFSTLTTAVKDGFTNGVFNPFETLFTQSPWYLTVVVVLALAGLLGGARVVPVTAVCLGLLVATGLWTDAMATLAAVLVATAATILLGVLVGVWLGRSRAADRILRPVLDAAQVMPAFVYLVPSVGLFGPSRFTAIVGGRGLRRPGRHQARRRGRSARSPATVVEAAPRPVPAVGRSSPRCSCRWPAGPSRWPPTRA